jgi:hypothetical protein
MSAGAVLEQAVMAALRTVPGLGVHERLPVQAAHPYASVDAGLETDWSHKGGTGREVRLSIAIRDRGESANRLRLLCDAVEAAVAGLGASVGEWRIVTMALLRMRVARDGEGQWAGLVEFRARLLLDQ